MKLLSIDSSARHRLLNAILFQCVWCASILLGPSGSIGWAFTALALLFIATARKHEWSLDLALAGGLAVVGFLVDTLWIRMGILDYQGARTAPVWIVVLWAATGLTLRHSLQLLLRRPWLGALAAGVFAPFSYAGGGALEAVAIPDPARLAWVGFGWFALFAIVLTVVRRLEVAMPAGVWATGGLIAHAPDRAPGDVG